MRKRRHSTAGLGGPKHHGFLIRDALLIAVFVASAGCRLFSDPRPVIAWKSVVPGGLYTCGLSATNDVYCWGGSSGLRVGPPAPLDSLMPTSAVPLLIPGGQRFVEITVGIGPVCGLDAEAAAYCWGDNSRGELGDSSYVAKRAPSPVGGGHRWRSLSAGGSNVCGISLEGGTYCWGNQFRGTLGNGELDGSSPLPVRVTGEVAFAKVWPYCALALNGDAYCWGPNDYGMLGDGEPPEPFKESSTPSRVVGGHRFSSLTLGTSYRCGITDDGRAYCWGWNIVGQLGNGSTQHTSTPTLVSGNQRWRLLSAGDSHTCGITIDGDLYCWGGNERGQFGNGTVFDMSATPILIESKTRFVTIVAGGYTTCGLTTAGSAFCWGRGDYGQLGNGIMANSSHPLQVRSP